jgi:hypothetical protein
MSVLKAFSAAGLIAMLGFWSVGATIPSLVSAHDDENQDCTTLNMVSGTSTQTAGYSETNPVGTPGSLSTSSYSGTGWTNASLTQTVIPPWVDPATDATFSGSGAQWVSTGASWPGGDGNTEGVATTSQWRLFHQGFEIPANATIESASLDYTADNSAAVYLNGNGTPLASTDNVDVYGDANSANSNFSQVFSTDFTPVVGQNSLDFVVRNDSSADATTNPTGLLYKASVRYCVPHVPPPPSTVKVTIVKFIDGVMATADSAHNNDFAMNATWNADNIGSGSGSYTLSASGYNGDPTPYKAVTTDMDSGADYGTTETMNDMVGANCTSGKPYALMGYTSGDTLAQAMGATPSADASNLTDITSNKYIIVWNDDCTTETGGIGGTVETSDDLKVTSVDSVDTSASADGSFANGWKYVFHITVPTAEPNLALKFADWARNGGGGTIPVANDMRISSAQADNSGAKVLLTAANTYSSPDLHITGDLDPLTPGYQVEVAVEVAVPSGTPNGSYNTSYGVRSAP